MLYSTQRPRIRYESIPGLAIQGVQRPVKQLIYTTAIIDILYTDTTYGYGSEVLAHFV